MDAVEQIREVTSDEDLVRPYSQPWLEGLQQLLGETACRQLGLYAIPDDLLLSVVIPVFNECKTLPSVVERVCSVPVRKEVVIVDDGSTDGTADVMATLKSSKPLGEFTESIRTLSHDRNRGKGAAVRTGFGAAQGDIVLVQDADLEYSPSEYPRLLQPIVENAADVVFGSRFLGDQPHRVLYFWHYVGNRCLTTLSNCFTNLNLTDMETCFKVFRRTVLDDVAPTLRQDRFGIEPEITAKVARRGYRIFEMSISYFGRTYDQGKKINWRDGVAALWCIVRYGLFR